MMFAAPLWLAVWLLLPVWLLWRRRPQDPALADTGALALWDGSQGQPGERRRARSRPRAAEWLAWAALLAASLALARPLGQGATGPLVLEVWLERLPGAFLPARGGSGPSRLDAALEQLVRAADRVGPLLWRWRTPGAEAGQVLAGPGAAEWIDSLGPDPRPLKATADDRPGVLWLLLDPPEVPPRFAGWAVLAGDRVPGPVAVEDRVEPGQAPRWIEWDGERLQLGAPADAGRLQLDPRLPEWLERFAALWAANRGLSTASAPGAGATALVLGQGPELTEPLRVRWAGMELVAQPESGVASGDLDLPALAVEPRGEFDWSLGPPSAPWAISGSSGRLDWARARWEPPRGDPARVALGLCELFDRARRMPAACVPLEQRRERAPGPLRPGIEQAFDTALARATAAQKPPPRSLSLYPALAALAAALAALALGFRAPAGERAEAGGRPAFDGGSGLGAAQAVAGPRPRR